MAGIMGIVCVVMAGDGVDGDAPSVDLNYLNQNSSLNRSTISYRFILVNALAKLLPTEENLKNLLHLGNSGIPANKEHLVDTSTALIHRGIFQATLDRVQAIPKEIHVKLLESGTSKCPMEINAVEQAINMNGGLNVC
ncbi:hypothetical protein RJ640_000584 [Escallonia rubra]|uniref:Uncharacterized protein n=1 Tax=Escallonia rubra TaxID=112253 RepID=A0AA88QVQ0_9ASTE|nr:hypothetical protein RJ640_000584 [Escallonia rubra]